MSERVDLACPFPDNLVRSNPSGGGSYVPHGIIKQRLLSVVGPYDFRLVEVLRGYVPAKAPNPNGTSQRAKDGTPALENAVVGAVFRLSLLIDGERIEVEAAGDCEDPNNWPHDGARLKDAESDAFKRCCAHIGLGLHLWCPPDKGGYFLYDDLQSDPEPPSQPVASIDQRNALRNLVARLNDEQRKEYRSEDGRVVCGITLLNENDKFVATEGQVTSLIEFLTELLGPDTRGVPLPGKEPFLPSDEPDMRPAEDVKVAGGRV